MQTLTTLTQLDELLAASAETPVLLFKHSTRCSVSATADAAFRTVDGGLGDAPGVTMVHLDLLAHREISDAIEARLGVTHKSPQAILVKAGAAVWDTSHFSITVEALRAAITEHAA